MALDALPQRRGIIRKAMTTWSAFRGCGHTRAYGRLMRSSFYALECGRLAYILDDPESGRLPVPQISVRLCECNHTVSDAILLIYVIPVLRCWP